jgi:hypothetical protein
MRIILCACIVLINLLSTMSYADEFCDIANVCVQRDGTKKYNLVWLKTLISGEDALNDLIRVEQRYSTIPVGGTTARINADQLYKTGVGYVKGISCYSDAAATAGTITLLDNTVAGSGNILWSFDVQVLGYPIPFQIDLETSFSVGLFLDFTTTNDMFCTVRYR